MSTWTQERSHIHTRVKLNIAVRCSFHSRIFLASFLYPQPLYHHHKRSVSTHRLIHRQSWSWRCRNCWERNSTPLKSRMRSLGLIVNVKQEVSCIRRNSSRNCWFAWKTSKREAVGTNDRYNHFTWWTDTRRQVSLYSAFFFSSFYIFCLFYLPDDVLFADEYNKRYLRVFAYFNKKEYDRAEYFAKKEKYPKTRFLYYYSK